VEGRDRQRERERERDLALTTLASVAAWSKLRDPGSAREMEESIYKNNRYTLIKVRIANVIYHSLLFLSSSLPRGSAGGCRHRGRRPEGDKYLWGAVAVRDNCRRYSVAKEYKLNPAATATEI